MRALICSTCKSPQDPDERECPACGSDLVVPALPATDEDVLRQGGMTIAIRPTAKLIVKRSA